MKKYLIVLLTIVSALGLVACKKDEITEDPDVAAPLFLDLIQGKLATIEHLEGEEVDLMEGVRVRDDVDEVEDIVVEIDDLGGYDKDTHGTYTLVYSATDTSDNTSTVERVVIVEEAMNISLDYALVSNGSYIQAVYNDPEALKLVGSNAKFRNRSDLINVLDKDDYLEQLEEYYPDSHPGFAWGNVAIINEEGQLAYMRFAQGAQFEMDIDGDIVYDQEELIWFASHGGGDLLKGIDQDFLDEIIPNGGKVLLAPSETGNYGDLARIFLIKNLVWSEYMGGGGVTKDVIDVPLENRKVELIKDFEVKIKMPEALEAPEISIDRHILSWEPVVGAKGYDLFLNGEKDNESLLTGTTINLLDYFEDEEVGTEFDIEVKAITVNPFANTDSEKSNTLNYEIIEILRMETPVVENDEGVLRWDEVEGAASYEVYLKIATTSFLVDEVTINSFDPNTLDKKDFGGNNLFYVKGIGSDEYSDSENSNQVVIRVEYETELLTINNMKTDVVIMSAENYFSRRNAGSADETRLENYLYLVEGIKEYMDSGNTVNEAFSSVALISPESKVTFVRNILAKQTYFEDEGWFVDESYAANNAQLVKIEDYIKEDDRLLVGKNGLKVTYLESDDEKEMDARDFLAYHFIKSWTLGESEGWRKPMSEFIDSKTVEFTLE